MHCPRALAARRSTASHCRPRVACKTLSPSPPTGCSRDVAVLAARGRLSSPRGETKRLPALGDRSRRRIGIC
ncbi:hypothetical protein GW17_00027949 [Ensete ventricosum]|nr:hypothetical protein GW17_00027949 [Ensete ventricosum]